MVLSSFFSSSNRHDYETAFTTTSSDDSSEEDCELQEEYGESDSDGEEVEMRGLINKGNRNENGRGKRPPTEVLVFNDLDRPSPFRCTRRTACVAFALLLCSISMLIIAEKHAEKRANNKDHPFDVSLKSERERMHNKTIPKNQHISAPGIQRISVIGERNSGVTWLTKNLAQCFPDVEVEAALTRPAHWFQSKEMHDSSVSTAVVHVTLNPYDWIDTMRLKPHYMPLHMNMEWEPFIAKPWTMERPDRDLNYLKNNKETDKKCQMKFRYNEVVSCVRDNSPEIQNPIYELNVDRSGEAYPNILEFRAAKIRNHKNVNNWPNVTYLQVHYEKFTYDGGFQTFINDDFQAKTGLKINCDLTHPYFLAPKFWRKQLDPKFMRKLNQDIVWETEWSVSYDLMEYHEEDEEVTKYEWHVPPNKYTEYSKLTLPPIPLERSFDSSSDLKQILEDTHNESFCGGDSINCDPDDSIASESVLKPTVSPSKDEPHITPTPADIFGDNDNKYLTAEEMNERVIEKAKPAAITKPEDFVSSPPVALHSISHFVTSSPITEKDALKLPPPDEDDVVSSKMFNDSASSSYQEKKDEPTIFSVPMNENFKEEETDELEALSQTLSYYSPFEYDAQNEKMDEPDGPSKDKDADQVDKEESDEIIALEKFLNEIPSDDEVGESKEEVYDDGQFEDDAVDRAGSAQNNLD